MANIKKLTIDFENRTVEVQLEKDDGMPKMAYMGRKALPKASDFRFLLNNLLENEAKLKAYKNNEIGADKLKQDVAVSFSLFGLQQKSYKKKIDIYTVNYHFDYSNSFKLDKLGE